MRLKNSSNPILYIYPRAKQKMDMLIALSSGEIAWHGYVERHNNIFTIFDIILYPQYVTGASVTPDDKEYTDWLINQFEYNEEKANKMRFHGHSHVNMGCTPSGTDMHFREDITKNLGKDDFYIFMICNKKGDYTLEIYDNTTGIVYDEKDVSVVIADEKETERNYQWAQTVIAANIKEKRYGKCSTTSKVQSSSTQAKSQTAKSTSSDVELSEEQWERYYRDWGYGDY